MSFLSSRFLYFIYLGINVVPWSTPTEKALEKWYKGPTLYEVLVNTPEPPRPVNRPLRITVFRSAMVLGTGETQRGWILTGTLRESDLVVSATPMPPELLGQDQTTSKKRDALNVQAIEVNYYKVQKAMAGDPGISHPLHCCFILVTFSFCSVVASFLLPSSSPLPLAVPFSFPFNSWSTAARKTTPSLQFQKRNDHLPPSRPSSATSATPPLQGQHHV